MEAKLRQDQTQRIQLAKRFKQHAKPDEYERSIEYLDTLIERVERYNRGKSFLASKISSISVQLPSPYVLKPYQQDGVNWLYRLGHLNDSGILADEMGLGKTL